MQYLAQAYFDPEDWIGGVGDWTVDLPVGGTPALPPEPQLPLEFIITHNKDYASAVVSNFLHWKKLGMIIFTPSMESRYNDNNFKKLQNTY